MILLGTTSPYPQICFADPEANRQSIIVEASNGEEALAVYRRENPIWF